ncbi:MAG: thioredoxin domain-containing protein [Chloroflexi bacterium]|nr:thioredoxin domain-containing protein [Chloroflexota bacterium]
MENNYVKTGKLTFTYKYLPIFPSGESIWAAQAAECANQQGKFWEYHNRLFQVWTGENVGTYTKSNLKQYAADLKLDATTFNQCLDSDKTLPIVQADIAEANRLGIHQTPTFLINSRVLQIQSLDYGQFSRTFDSLLK